jgi:hypothetical protein
MAKKLQKIKILLAKWKDLRDGNRDIFSDQNWEHGLQNACSARQNLKNFN